MRPNRRFRSAQLVAPGQRVRPTVEAGEVDAPGQSALSWEAQTIEDFFGYTSTISSIAAAAVANDVIEIEANSYFKLTKLCCFADIAAAVQTDSSRVIPLVTLQITDTGAGRRLFDAAVPIPNLMGYGALPFILPVPRIFKPRASILLEYTNFSAATTYALRVSLFGSKLYV